MPMNNGSWWAHWRVPTASCIEMICSNTYRWALSIVPVLVAEIGIALKSHLATWTTVFFSGGGYAKQCNERNDDGRSQYIKCIASMCAMSIRSPNGTTKPVNAGVSGALGTNEQRGKKLIRSVAIEREEIDMMKNARANDEKRATQRH